VTPRGRCAPGTSARIYLIGDTLDVLELDAVRQRFRGIDAMII